MLTFIFLEREAGEDGEMTARRWEERLESCAEASVRVKPLKSVFALKALRVSVVSLYILVSEVEK